MFDYEPFPLTFDRLHVAFLMAVKVESTEKRIQNVEFKCY